MKNVVRALIVLCLGMLLGVCAYASSYTDALDVAYDPPIEAVLPNGTHMTPVDYRGYYLCLPGNISLEDVSFVYTGKEQLYLPDSDTFVKSGESFTAEVEAGECYFYEYLSASDLYYKYKVQIMQGSAISSLYIDFDDSYTFNVLNYLGKNKENFASGTISMLDGDGKVLYDGVLENIRCRGNSSFGSPGLQGDKKSFNIKLAEKAELIPGVGEMRKWSLLHMRIDTEFDYDLTGLTTILGLGAYDAISDDGYHTVATECVDVYIEGEYRGAYILVERLDVNAAVDITDSDKLIEGEERGYEYVDSSSDPAVAAGVQWYRYVKGIEAMDGLDVTGGYVLEVTGGPDRCAFTTSRGITFDLKAPELCTKEQMQYISMYVQAFEDALYSPTGYNAEGKHYTEYIDVKSFADGILTYGFFQNWELMRTSTYLYKDVVGSEREKLTFGPVWDFETGAETFVKDETLFGKHNFYKERRQYAWIEQLWMHADFMSVANESAKALSEHMHGMLDGDDAGVYENLDRHMDSLSMNWTRWGLYRAMNIKKKYRDIEQTYPAHAANHIEALRTRLARWDELWSEDDYLLGATSESVFDKESDEYVLTVTPVGKADGYQWYKITDDGEHETITGANEATLKVSEEGRYYCAVYGSNNAFYKGTSGRVFSERGITMGLTVSTVQTVGSGDIQGGMLWIFIGFGALILAAVVAGGVTIVKSRKK